MRKALSAAVCGAVLALAFTVSAETLRPGIITIVRIQGIARYSLDNQNWHPLVVGKALNAGAVIQTGHDAEVDIILGKSIDVPQASQWPDRIGPAPDYPVRGMIDYQPSAEQNMVRMMGDAVLAIDKLTISDSGVDAVSDTELDLRQGRIFCSVRKLSAASQYLVKIPNGIAGVRGTIFGIDANGWCAVYRGSVLLSLIGPDGKPYTVVISEGNYFSFNAPSGQGQAAAPGGQGYVALSARGQIYASGGQVTPSSSQGQVMPMTAGMIAFLGDISRALDTLYVEVLSFAYDHTIVWVSPTTGRR